MNTGRSYAEALAQARANARRSGTNRYIFTYAKDQWVEESPPQNVNYTEVFPNGTTKLHGDHIIHGFKVGDYARNVESGWLGKIRSFGHDHNGDLMAEMVGVDAVATHVMGMTREQSLCEDDVQWHDPRDLKKA